MLLRRAYVMLIFKKKMNKNTKTQKLYASFAMSLHPENRSLIRLPPRRDEEFETAQQNESVYTKRTCRYNVDAKITVNLTRIVGVQDQFTTELQTRMHAVSFVLVMLTDDPHTLFPFYGRRTIVRRCCCCCCCCLHEDILGFFLGKLILRLSFLLFVFR